MRNPEFPVKRFVFSKYYHFLIIPFLGLLFDQINVLNNPQRSALTNIQQQGFQHYLKYFFLQLYLFELISFFILAKLIALYSRWLKMDRITTELKPFLVYELKWFPFFALSIFIFGPITNFFRYVFLVYPSQGWKDYFPHFFMSVPMYFNYFIPIIVWGYLIINIDLLMSYLHREKETTPASVPVTVPSGEAEQAPWKTEAPFNTHNYLTVIEGNTPQGTTIVAVQNILWFEVQRKTYYATNHEETYTIKKTIAELEMELSPDNFFRINRSQLININAIQNYSYWEFEKYIIRLKGREERDFVITRKRFKELKVLLEKAKQPV